MFRVQNLAKLDDEFPSKRLPFGRNWPCEDYRFFGRKFFAPLTFFYTKPKDHRIEQENSSRNFPKQNVTFSPEGAITTCHLPGFHYDDLPTVTCACFNVP